MCITKTTNFKFDGIISNETFLFHGQTSLRATSHSFRKVFFHSSSFSRFTKHAFILNCQLLEKCSPHEMYGYHIMLQNSNKSSFAKESDALYHFLFETGIGKSTQVDKFQHLNSLFSFTLPFDEHEIMDIIQLSRQHLTSEHSISIIEWFRVRGISISASIYNHLLSSFFEKKEWNPLLQLYRLSNEDHVLLNSFSYHCIISACSKKGLWKTAMHVLMRLETEHESFTKLHSATAASAYRQVISACVRHGQTSTSVLLLKRWNSIRPADVSLYNAILGAFAQKGQWQVAISMITEMMRNRIRPGVVTWSIVVHACACGGVPDVAAEVMAKMKLYGIVPNVVTWTSLIHAYAKHGDWSNAELAFDDMIQQGIMPNQASWGALMSSYSPKGKWQKAIQTLQKMAEKNIPVSLPIFNSAISAVGNGGKWRLLGYILHEMKENHGCSPSIVTYSSIIKAYGDAGQIRKACDAFEEMIFQGIKPNVVACNAMLRAFFRSKQFSKALMLFESYEQFGVTADKFTYTAILWGCGFCKRQHRAEEFFQKMKLKGCFPDQVTYNTLIDTYEKNGNWSKAIRVLEAMQPDT